MLAVRAGKGVVHGEYSKVKIIAQPSFKGRVRYDLKLAEGEGFEPSIPFWGIHTFQACAFNHSAIPPAWAIRLSLIRLRSPSMWSPIFWERRKLPERPDARNQSLNLRVRIPLVFGGLYKSVDRVAGKNQKQQNYVELFLIETIANRIDLLSAYRVF